MPTPGMGAALDRLWAHFLPEIESRVQAIEMAAAALRNGNLTADQRDIAHQAAHKLAGTLGTFGVHRGSEIAQWAEAAMEAEAVPPSAEEYGQCAAELRLLVKQRASGHDACTEVHCENCSETV